MLTTILFAAVALSPTSPTIAISAPSIVQSAQLPVMDPFYFHAADVKLLEVKSIQKELKITEAQRAKMNVFAAQHDQHLNAMASEYKAKGKTEDDARKDPRLLGYFIELKKNVMAQLTPAQLKRLGELSLQHLGMACLVDNQVGKKVGLSDAQITKMRDLFTANSREYGAAEKAIADPVLAKYKDKHVNDQKAAEALQKQFDADLEAAMKKNGAKLAAIKKKTETSMKAVLNAKQQAAYLALLGKPFQP